MQEPSTRQEPFASKTTVTAARPRIGCGQIIVNWLTSVVGVNGISIERTVQSTGGTSTVLSLTTPPLKNSWPDKSMKCGVNYLYTVNLWSSTNALTAALLDSAQ